MGISKVEYNGETLLDISGDTVTPDTLAEGSTAHNSNGEQITGRAVFSGGGGTVSGAVMFPCYLSVQQMKIYREDGGLIIPTEDVVNAWNNNIPVFMKLDVSQMAPEVQGIKSYVLAPMTQYAEVPGQSNIMMYFDFAMVINGVPHIVNALVWSNSSAASVTLTPLATAT